MGKRFGLLKKQFAMNIAKPIPVTFLAICLAVSSCKPSTGQPNIVLIMTDDQGWFDVGFNGNNKIRTSNLDMLASNGIILDRFYSASPVCSPTRASVLTGRNPLRLNIPGANKGHLMSEEITLPELLKERGYSTGHFGKWHLGTLTRDTPDSNRGGRKDFIGDYSIPAEHGYNEFFCTESKVPTFDPMVYPAYFTEGESKRFGWTSVEANEKTEPYGTAYWKGENEKETQNLKGDDSRIIMDRVIPFIENSAKDDKPFFATIWFHTPHLPVVSDSAHRVSYKHMSLDEQIYYGTLTALDEQIGRLWSKLKELNLREETVIWFCSDNGPENKTPGSAGPFRKRKRSLYEGGVRVPAFVVWENQLPGGRRLDFPAVTSDYLPTIVDLVDLNYPDNRPIDGQSILQLLYGTGKEREKSMGFIYRDQMSWVNNRFKLISHDKGNSFELYDLIDDKGEKNNLIEEKAAIARKMRAGLFQWLSSVEKSKKGMDYDQ